MNPWIMESQPTHERTDRELEQQVYDLMEKFARNPSNGDRHFEAMMVLVEDKQRRDREYDLESGQWEEAIKRKLLSEVERWLESQSHVLMYATADKPNLGIEVVKRSELRAKLNQLKGEVT